MRQELTLACFVKLYLGHSHEFSNSQVIQHGRKVYTATRKTFSYVLNLCNLVRFSKQITSAAHASE